MWLFAGSRVTAWVRISERFKSNQVCCCPDPFGDSLAALLLRIFFFRASSDVRE